MTVYITAIASLPACGVCGRYLEQGWPETNCRRCTLWIETIDSPWPGTMLEAPDCWRWL